MSLLGVKHLLAHWATARERGIKQVIRNVFYSYGDSVLSCNSLRFVLHELVIVTTKKGKNGKNKQLSNIVLHKVISLGISFLNLLITST